MRSRALTLLALAAFGLASNPGRRVAWAHPNFASFRFVASPASRPPIEVKPVTASLLAPAPALSAFATSETNPGAWSMGRKLGLGLMLAAPFLASGSFYYRSKANAEASALATGCPDSCVTRSLPEAGPRAQGSAAPWLLLGAAGAASLGGGLLFWINRPSKTEATAPRAALQVGRDGHPSAVIFGKF